MYLTLLEKSVFFSRVLFIVNLVIFLLLIIFSYTVFPVLFMRYCYSVLDCAISMNRCLIICDSNNLSRTSTDSNLRFLQLPLSNSLFVVKVFILKNAGQINPILWDSLDFQQPIFCPYNNFTLVSHSQDHCFFQIFIIVT